MIRFSLPVTSAQCNIGAEKYPDSSISLNYDDEGYSQGYRLKKEGFKDLTKDDILEPCIRYNDFRSSNDGNVIGYTL